MKKKTKQIIFWVIIGLLILGTTGILNFNDVFAVGGSSISSTSSVGVGGGGLL